MLSKALMFLGLLLVLLMGCEGETPAPVSVSSPMPMTTASPTPALSPTVSPSPTATSTPMPTATATASPTATPHPLPGAPDVPSLVSVSPTEISVVWKEPDSLAPISGYDYRYAEESSPSPWVEVADSGLTDRGVTITGLSPFTVYRVQVRAVSEHGHGDWSPTWLAQTRSVPTPTPTATPFLVQPHVMLRVVLVHDDQDGWRYSSTGGWTQAVVRKESDSLRYYEAAIWEETGSVHLYAFPNDYDGLYGTFGDIPADETIAYREQYAISVHSGLPEAYTDERSVFLQEAFELFTSLLVERHPDAEHHLMYSGHGGPGGALFEGQLKARDAETFLGAWAELLGRPVGVVDMGGPCNKGGYADLATFCEHARYYVASDLANGGYSLDDSTVEKYYETDAETQYHRLLEEHETLEDALIERVDLRRLHYEYARQNQTAGQVVQASYVYSCPAFNDFSVAFEEFVAGVSLTRPLSYDLRELLVGADAPPSLMEQYERVFVHAVDNRDFFTWDVTANGMISPLAWLASIAV